MPTHHISTVKICSAFILLIILMLGANHALADVNNHPDDPVADRAFIDSGSFANRPVSDIEANFNAARVAEASGLGISALPSITFPSQATWDGWSDNEKALFIINKEREARGLLPLTGSNAAATQLATDYAAYLGSNQLWGHDYDWDGDGTVESPWDRLAEEPAIGACRDFLGVAENLSVLVSSSSNHPQDEPVAVALYGWLYDDSSSAWGHRHALLWSSFTNNSGDIESEGLFGIGVWGGGPYQGPFSMAWPRAEMVVFKVFDPCASWVYPVVTSAELTQTTAHHTPNTATPFWLSIVALLLTIIHIRQYLTETSTK